METSNIPEMDVSKRSKISLTWILPLAAAFYGLWMAYQHYSNAGIRIRIHFPSAKGIIEEKTRIQYRGLTVGFVKQLELGEDEGVVCLVDINQDAAHLAVEGSQFWVVQPRISLEAVEDVDTLITGQYILVRPGDGPPATEFKGLAKPPDSDPNAPGLHLVLRAPKPGSLVVGSPVVFHSIQVGRVERFELAPNNEEILIQIYIQDRYRSLIRSNTCFWPTRGLTLTATLQEIKIDAESLTSLLRGGITFATPDPAGTEVAEMTEFPLFEDYERAVTRGVTVKLYMKTAEGLVPDRTVVRYAGMQVGHLTALDLVDGPRPVVATLLLTGAGRTMAAADTRFWIVRPKLNRNGVEGLDTLLSGARVEVRPGGGAARTEFNVDDRPPPPDVKGPGLHIVVDSDVALQVGSPVLYRKLEVGQVVGNRVPDSGRIQLQLEVFERYAHLVYDNSRFWNASGLRVDASLDGVKVEADSVLSVIYGGVAFGLADGQTPGVVAKTGDRFTLFGSYDEAMDRGLALTLSITDAQGLVAGRTPIKYNGMTVGRLTKLSLADGKALTASALLFDQAQSFARRDSRFYVIRPDISLNGVRHLDTLVRGPYLALVPGEGPPSTRFDVLNSPPPDEHAGLRLVLNADRMGSVRVGTPILYHQLTVGRVIEQGLAADGKRLRVELVVENRFASLVRENSRFWHASGLQVNADLNSGVNVQAESVEAMVRGGIAFDTPSGKQEPAASGGDRFELYDSRAAALDALVPIEIRFANADGVQVGRTVVKHRGVTVGKVTDMRLGEDGDIMVVVSLNANSAALAREGAAFWLVKPQVTLDGVTGLDTVLTGPYIEMSPGNGAPATRFVARDGAPAAMFTGKRIVLRGKRLHSLRTGAPVLFRGVKIGSISGYELVTDGVDVQVHIAREFQSLVTDKSLFWHASGLDFQLDWSGLRIHSESLAAVVTGAIAMDVSAGGSADAVGDGRRFVLHDNHAAATEQEPDFYVYVETPSLGSLRPGASVYYRQVPVGEILAVELSDDARQVAIKLGIEEKYRHLLRENSQFWNSSGVRLKVGFLGAQVRSKPLQSIIQGGIEFATPENDMGGIVRPGHRFVLHDKANDKWLKWQPAIPVE